MPWLRAAANRLRIPAAGSEREWDWQRGRRHRGRCRSRCGTRRRSWQRRDRRGRWSRNRTAGRLSRRCQHRVGFGRGTAAGVRYRLCAMHGCQRRSSASISGGVALRPLRIPLCVSSLPLVRPGCDSGFLRKGRTQFPPWLFQSWFPPRITGEAPASRGPQSGRALLSTRGHAVTALQQVVTR
jgi:hypothetical protein